MFKPVNEKQFRTETIAYLVIFLINLPLFISRWLTAMQWYEKVFIIFFSLLLIYYSYVMFRTLVDNSFRRRRFIARNDERNLEIQEKCLRNTAVLTLILAGGSYGLAMGLRSTVKIDLLLLAIAFTSLIVLTYLVSWLYYHFRG